MNFTRHPQGVGLKDLLPQYTDNLECVAPSGVCFHAGDARASEQPSLAGKYMIVYLTSLFAGCSLGDDCPLVHCSALSLSPIRSPRISHFLFLAHFCSVVYLHMSFI